MIYSSPEFFILLTCTVGLFLLCKGRDQRAWILLIANFVFYAWAGVFDTLIFLSIVLVSWLATMGAKKYPAHRKAFIASGVLAMVLHLFFWKYAPWLASEIQKIMPHFLGGRKLKLALPIGISFFTLQGIAYMIDLLREKTDFIPFDRYLLFKSFFPQLVAGPIVRVKQLLPQIEKLRIPSNHEIAEGILLFTLGFMKKVLIADRIAPFVDIVFATSSQTSRSALALALLGYAVQIWGDFSGYTDMGRGAARMFGITLPENFLSPYLAKSPSEFWSRWHITLSQWIRDYIYIPMGGNRGSFLRVSGVTLLTMAISGLWHGANWTFILWGIYHGLLLIIERIFRLTGIPKAMEAYMPSWLLDLLGGATTFTAICLGWLIFRAENLSAALNFINGILKNDYSSALPNYAANAKVGIALCAFIQITSYFSFKTEKAVFWPSLKKSVNNILNPVNAIVSGIIMSVIIVFCIFMRMPGSHPFIYFQF